MSKLQMVSILSSHNQNESKIEHLTFLVFYIVVLTIFNAIFNKKPNEI